MSNGVPPSEVTILGQRVEVVMYEGAVLVPGRMYHEDGSDHDHGEGFLGGHSSLQYGSIGLSYDMSDDQLADTFLHELFHMFTFYAQVDIAEVDVMRLAPIMLDFLRRNPAAVRYLTGGKVEQINATA